MYRDLLSRSPLKRALSSLLLGGGCLISSLHTASAQAVPEYWPYQGFILDSNGDPVESPVNLTINVYSDALAAIPIWSGNLTNVSVVNGSFAVDLGEVGGAQLQAAINQGQAQYIGVSVNGAPELTPRTRIGAIPYATVAGNAFALGGLPADSFVTQETFEVTLQERIQESVPNLDDLNAEVAAVREIAEGAQTAADTAQGTADQANTAAQNASNSASAAQDTADQANTAAQGAAQSATNAQNTADQANNAAQGAAQSATNAQNTADQANTAAQGAAQSATNAQNTADQANTAAQGAAQSATNAQNTADQANTAAQAAAQAATNAQNTADQANTAAQAAAQAATNAQSTADQANTAAQAAAQAATNAQNTADQASVAATNAQNTANEAVDSAGEAQTAADTNRDEIVAVREIAETALTEEETQALIETFGYLNAAAVIELITAFLTDNNYVTSGQAQAISDASAAAASAEVESRIDNRINALLARVDALETSQGVQDADRQALRDRIAALEQANIATQNALDQAAEAAEAARVASEAASVAAGAAQTAADQAQGTADAAQGAADAAQGTADAAQVAANAAQGTADGAQGTADAAQGAAQAAADAAAAAAQTASDAADDADTALTNAQAALDAVAAAGEPRVLGPSAQTSDGWLRFTDENGTEYQGVRAAGEMCKASYSNEPNAHFCSLAELQAALSLGNYDSSINTLETWVYPTWTKSNGGFTDDNDFCQSLLYNSADAATGTTVRVLTDATSTRGGIGVRFAFNDVRQCNTSLRVLCCR